MSGRDESMIAALKRERAAYAAAGDTDRVGQVDEQLRHYGYEGEQDAVVDPAGAPVGRSPRSGRQRTTAADAGKSGDSKGEAGKSTGGAK